ncbi:MAG: chromosome segregation protein SMC [Nitrospirae bacterium]|nr:chromosome segregation protein SMC [Nitrospirota bacterium]
MRIDRIELIGFKSFSEKTIFNFHPGVTAIVGPNGCGKSNIVDAFKWVLGEQSAKSLRGDSMEDVIFNGSASKKPKGMAEVTLVISGINSHSDNGNPAETSDITVTRRLFRSGESEYLMNKTHCRLKDIKNVFLDTGLELKTYSILEQGRMDAILNSKPQDRRFLIEEVAGVMKYNVRKAEALQKLESSQMNLQRLQDIVAEVKRQISSIERYAKRAEKYKQIFDEIKVIEIKIAARDASLLGAELRDISASDNSLKLKETELSANIHSMDGLIEEKKLSCTDNERSLQELQNRLHASERELIEEEGRISLFKSDCENLRGRLQRLITRDSELGGEKENISIQIADIEQKNIEIDRELTETENAFNSKNEALSSMEREIADLESKLDSGRKNIFSKADELSSLKNEISSLVMMMENLDKREKKNNDDITIIRNDISLHSSLIKEMQEEYGRLDAGLKDKYRTRETCWDDFNEKKNKRTEREDALYRDREEFAALVSRSDSLKEMDAARRSAVADRVNIHGQISDIFEPAADYETAIEAALGDKLNVAVVDDHDEIKKALTFVKEKNIERSGFLSAKISVLSQPAFSAPEFSENIIGKALDFVKVREGFENVAALLLNDVIIVDNLNTAFNIWDSAKSAPRSGSPFYFVTLEGEVLEPSGIVFGGTEKNILKIKREIRELGKGIESKREQILIAEEEVAALKNNIIFIEEDLIAINNDISGMEKSHHEFALKLANLQEEDARLQKKLEYMSLELEQDSREKAGLLQTLNDKNEICGNMENEKRSIEETLRGTQAELSDKKAMLETLRSELTEIMVSQSSQKANKDYYIKESERLNSSLLDIDKKREEMSAERHEIETSIEYKEAEVREKEEALKSIVIITKQLEDESIKMNDILEAKTAELNLMEKQQKVNSDGLTNVRKELSQVEIRMTEVSLKLAHMKEDIKKSYNVDLDAQGEQIAGETVSREEEETLPGLKEKLQGIGPVNLGTLEELDELKTRYDFLAKQQGDLLQSITSLQETITKINSTTRKKLADAFEALNEKFKEVFATLFGKGRAELILTEENILNAGIEIVAQPPGKKLQNLMLLSGGEKALTALSVLFAGFMIKPTPLCLLDEVDAPLDESNTERFSALLGELAKHIQFITITHNRRTMEVADYIYGITMEEPGTSKVVSMHMAEMRQ